MAFEALSNVQRRVLDVARECDYEGFSKHDALNAAWLETFAGSSRWLRLLAIQFVMRFPINVRPVLGVRRARNPKGIALFARALMSRHRVLGDPESAAEARALLHWLVDHPSGGFRWACWGYPYPWQDIGFFAPRNYPNRVVTSFVVHALLDGYEVFQDTRLLQVAIEGVRFLLEAPRTLYQDSERRCVSYVPDDKSDWIVLDVSALAGAAAARLAAIDGDGRLLEESGRLIRYVVSKQTDYGAWFYAEPPSTSHITHDNYHTGFILDAIQGYTGWARSDEFADAHRRGLRFYREHLFEADGAPRFMDKVRYPFDIHGAAQGIITFSLAGGIDEGYGEFSSQILRWTLLNMFDPSTGWFFYQKRRFFRTRIPLLRWCQAWMAWALAIHLEQRGELT